MLASSSTTRIRSPAMFVPQAFVGSDAGDRAAAPDRSISPGLTDNRDRLDLDLRPAGKRCNLNGRPGRRILRKELGIDGVHLAKLAQVAHEDGGLHRQGQG